MADDKLQQKLADYVEDAHAMEQNDLKMIDSMISTTDDPQMKEMLEDHMRETKEHERRLRERLDALGRGTSARKQAQAVGAALLKGVGDVARGDKAGKNARDGYTAEHMEIAAYQLLERLAKKAGDTETAEVARQNRADEEEMARRIDQSWDRTLKLTLECLAAMLDCTASWKDERLLRRPKEEDSRSRREGDAQDRSRSYIRRWHLLGQTLRRHGRSGPVAGTAEAPR